jgi:hypothetical protein
MHMKHNALYTVSYVAGNSKAATTQPQSRPGLLRHHRTIRQVR